MLISHLQAKNGQLTHLRTAASNKIILLIGRSNVNKKSTALLMLLNELSLDGYTLFWYGSWAESTGYLLADKSDFIVRWLNHIFSPQESFIKKYLIKIIKGMILIGYPSRWGYFFRRLYVIEISEQIKDLKKILRALGHEKSVTILAQSSGCIIASHLQIEANLEKIIGFGYPFKHPDKDEEPERTIHLKDIQKPFLIIQGNNDEYGGSDIVSRYELSPLVKFEFVTATHEYENLSANDWSRVIKRIKSFLELNT